MKQETEKMGEVHADLSTQLSSAVQRMMDFISRQKAEIKPVRPLPLACLVLIAVLSGLLFLYIERPSVF